MRRVITAEDVPAAGDWRIPIGAIITPSAREMAASRGVRLIELPEDQCSALAAPEKTVAIGADHGGFRLKEALKPLLESLGFTVRDVGVYDDKPADYPDIAVKVADLVASGSGHARHSDRWRGYRFVHGGEQGPGHSGGPVL